MAPVVLQELLLQGPQPGSTAYSVTFFAVSACLTALVAACFYRFGKTRAKASNEYLRLTLRAEAAENLAVDLHKKQEERLAVLRERDRHFQEYTVLMGPYTTNEQYQEWNKASWKKLVRNGLDMIKLVRPATYADYRARILGLSPTFGQHLPTLAAKAWLNWPFTLSEIDSQFLERGLANFVDEECYPSALNLDYEVVQNQTFSSEEVNSFLIELQDAKGPTEQELLELFSPSPAATLSLLPTPNPAESFLAELLETARKPDEKEKE